MMTVHIGTCVFLRTLPKGGLYVVKVDASMGATLVRKVPEY